jgi:hypothetical protein
MIIACVDCGSPTRFVRCAECREEVGETRARRPRWPRVPVAPPPPIDVRCKRCGQAFTPRRPAKYCSTRCRVAASHDRARLDGRYAAALAAQRAEPHIEHELTCVVCAAAFTARWRKAKYCSKTCSHAVSNPRGRVTRRAAMSAVWVEHVDRDVVGARDGWRCGICRSKIRRTLTHPHPRSASLDHVEPLSLGGEHSYANTRIAHLFCNLSRGNRVNNDQLAFAI